MPSLCNPGKRSSGHAFPNAVVRVDKRDADYGLSKENMKRQGLHLGAGELRANALNRRLATENKGQVAPFGILMAKESCFRWRFWRGYNASIHP